MDTNDKSRSRTKRRGKRNNKRNRQQTGPKKNNAPPPPQTKLILRNIGDAEKYGTVEQILGMLQKILNISNTKTGSQYSIEVDRSSIMYLIREEESSKKFLSDFEASRQTADTGNEETTIEEGADKETKQSDPKEEMNENVQEDTKLDVIVAPKQNSSIPVITARALYVNPPKKTRRRGERPGYAYVLLIAPKIEKIEIPTSEETVPQEKMDPNAGNEPNNNVQETTTTTEETNVEGNDTTQDQEQTPQLVEEKAEVMKTVDTTSSTVEVPPAKPTPTVDYSREVAKGRLLLSRAIDFLTGLAQDDAKGPQEYAGCKIEPSMSGKTWKRMTRGDRREGTIETTSDYKNWLQGLTKKQEELSARPKPMPGGGGATNLLLADSTTSTNTDQDLPVSSLVQHLRAKRQELKRKKNKKKKEKGNKKTVGANAGGTTAAGAKKKKKKMANKKAPPQKTGAVAPTPMGAPMLLKPNTR